MGKDASAGRAVADVTVVVTSYNHQAFVEQCLDAFSAQTRPPRQLIIVDDFSTDDSAAVIDHWIASTGSSATFLRHTANRGICASLNEALELAEGTYFCHLSADDWPEADRLEVQVAAFERADPSAALVVSDIREVDGGGALIVDHDFGRRLGHVAGPANQSRLLSGLLAENVIPAPGVLMRTEDIRAIGGWDESLVFEDYDMWLRLAESHSIHYQPGIVSNYRVLPSSMLRSAQRRVSLLTSEAQMVAKHTGRSRQDDAVIERRLTLIARQLLELDDPGALRTVLELASRASPRPGLRRALRLIRIPGGFARLRKRVGELTETETLSTPS